MGIFESKPSSSLPRPCGYVYFLPPKDEVPLAFLQDSDIDDGCFKHYVMVLDQTPGDKYRFLLITSFGGKHLYEARETRYQGQWIPIAPYPRLKLGANVLHLQGGQTFNKLSCVKVDRIFEIDMKVLRPLNGRHAVPYRISPPSYDVLMREVKAKGKRISDTKSKKADRPIARHESRGLSAIGEVLRTIGVFGGIGFILYKLVTSS